MCRIKMIHFCFFQDLLFCQAQINLYSDVPAFLVYANNEIFIKFAYVWP